MHQLWHPHRWLHARLREHPPGNGDPQGPRCRWRLLLRLTHTPAAHTAGSGSRGGNQFTGAGSREHGQSKSSSAPPSPSLHTEPRPCAPSYSPNALPGAEPIPKDAAWSGVAALPPRPLHPPPPPHLALVAQRLQVPRGKGVVVRVHVGGDERAAPVNAQTKLPEVVLAGHRETGCGGGRGGQRTERTGEEHEGAVKMPEGQQ